MLSLEKSMLISVTGVPGTGKSYFAKNLGEKTGAVRLNSDAMKAAIFGQFEGMTDEEIALANAGAYRAVDYAAQEALRAGHDVVYDRNAHTREIRDRQRTLALAEGALSVLVWVQTPREIAMDRAITRQARNDQYVFNREEWRDVVARHDDTFDAPADDENFVIINGKMPFEHQYRIFTTHVCRLAMQQEE